jgi:O-methyltransferase
MASEEALEINAYVDPLSWDPSDRYLDLLKRSLTRFGLEKPSLQPIAGRKMTATSLHSRVSIKGQALFGLDQIVSRRGYRVGRVTEENLEARFNGADWPTQAETMVGWRRIDQVHRALDAIRREGLSGDLLEAGIWRGGVVIFMAAYVGVFGMTDRRVYGADSFHGLPKPDRRYLVDEHDEHHTVQYLAVSEADVKKYFAAYRVPMDQVQLVPGYFEDTLPDLDVEELALLRLDGDMYSSTIQTLEALYDKVVSRGFVIVDDFELKGARSAVEDFFEARAERPEWIKIDAASAYFRKS